MRLLRSIGYSKLAVATALTLCVGAGLASASPYIKGAMSINDLAQYRTGTSAQEAGQGAFNIADKPNSEPADRTEESPQDGFFEIDWSGLISTNPDIVGWIYVPGTNIDHAIVQANKANPQYYLSHDVFKQESVYGCPYLDADTFDQGGLDAPFPIAYGHHLINGQMFSDFAKYSNRDYARSHDKIILETPDELLVLKVIAVNIVDADEELIRTHFRNSEDFNAYLKECLAESEVVLDVSTAGSYDQVFCFVTCSYGSENERTLVYALDPSR